LGSFLASPGRVRLRLEQRLKEEEEEEGGGGGRRKKKKKKKEVSRPQVKGEKRQKNKPGELEFSFSAAASAASMSTSAGSWEAAADGCLEWGGDEGAAAETEVVTFSFGDIV